MSTIRQVCKKPKHVTYTLIKTIEAARKVYGISKRFKPDVSMWPADMQEHKLIEFDVQTVINAINGPRKVGRKVVNEQWYGNWSDGNEAKFYCWWRSVDVTEGGVSGRGLALHVVYYAYSYADVGPRLVFKERKRALHFAKYFKPLAEKYYLVK